MNPVVREAFERKLSGYDFGGGKILEIGVETNQQLLSSLPVFANAADTVLLDLSLEKFSRYHTVKANANELPFVADSFDCVVTNAVFEHDPRFWKALSELPRVTTEGGVVGIGVPGYSPAHRTPSWLERIGVQDIAVEIDTGSSSGESTSPAGSRSLYQHAYDTVPAPIQNIIRNTYGRLAKADKDATTPVLGTHGAPADYYRFSKNAVRDVFLNSCADVEVEEVLDPPRFVGVGRNQM